MGTVYRNRSGLAPDRAGAVNVWPANLSWVRRDKVDRNGAWIGAKGRECGQVRVFNHPTFGVVPSTFTAFRTNPRDTNVSTRDTIREMARTAMSEAHSPVVQAALQEALASSPPNEPVPERVKRIYNWTKRNVRVVEDERLLSNIFNDDRQDKEVLISPSRLLTMPAPQGDCDDFSMLLAAMLVSLPVGIDFVTVAADEHEPDRWSHVYVQVTLPSGEVLPLDASHGDFPGWETQSVTRRALWPVRSVSEGVGMVGYEIGSKSGLPDSPSGMGDIDWGSVLSTGITSGVDIFGKWVARPREGEFMQVGPGGATAYRMPPGPTAGLTTFPSFGGSSFGGNLMTWFIVGAAGLFLFMAVRGK